MYIYIFNHYNINDDFVFFWTNLGRTRVLYCLQHRFKAVLLGSFILATVVQLPSTLCQVISVAHEVQKTLRICEYAMIVIDLHSPSRCQHHINWHFWLYFQKYRSFALTVAFPVRRSFMPSETGGSQRRCRV